MTIPIRPDHTTDVRLSIGHAAPKHGQQLFGVVSDPTIPGQLVLTNGHPYVPRRGDNGRFVGGAYLAPKSGEALTLKFVVPVVQIDWPLFRAVVAEETKRAIEQERKGMQDNQLQAAETMLLEVALMLEGADVQDLTATYGPDIIALRRNVLVIWADQLKEVNNNIRNLNWQPNDVHPRFQEILNRSDVLRTLKVLGASLRVSAALSKLPDEANYLKHKQQYDKICEQLITPLRNRADCMNLEIGRAADDDYYWSEKSGPAHEKSQQHYAKRRKILAEEVERVIRIVRSCARWPDPSTVATDDSSVNQFISAPVFSIAVPEGARGRAEREVLP